MALFHHFLSSSKNEGPRLVTAAAMSLYLEKMLEEAKKIIIIVSPYIKMNTRVYHILKGKRECGVEIRIIYCEDFLHEEVASQLFKRKISMQNVFLRKTIFCWEV